MMYAAFPGVEFVIGGIIRLEAAAENCQFQPISSSGKEADSYC